MKRSGTVWAGAALLAAAVAACATRAHPPPAAAGAEVALSGGRNASMVYLARVPGGLIAIDLGWWGAEGAVRAALGRLGASPAEVTDVFLTHSHRDHVGAWRLLRGSRFNVAAAEARALTGEQPHRGWVVRAAEWVKGSGLPRPGELRVRTFTGDTAFVFGGDTLFAYAVPGHTAGSTAYLFRGLLFVGDAATHTRWGGFGPARRGYSDDAGAAAASLRSLWRRLPPGAVRQVCTAHARCSAFTADFLADVAR